MSIKPRIATSLTAAAITAAAVGGTVAAAPEANANVPSGRYTMWDNGKSAPATIRGGVIAIHNPGGTLRYSVHSTRSGGYADIGASRYVFNRHGRSYSGPIMLGPLTIGQTKLVPRR
ncbi:hypothetical protein ABLE94_02545 [Gordonia sp. VNK1]|uniref:hypothetical protein n=1 Tax=Gordonia oleivorans TaxID=3156618 RepID=UPI0032B47B12